MKRICILQTGGTITMVRNAAGVLEPSPRGDLIMEYLPKVREIAEVDVVHLFQLDSSDINPRHWKIMADAISERYNDYDGFVITHGTDTMTYTATALSFMLDNLSKPVVVTGSQLPLSDYASDGVMNLLNAIRIACESFSEVAILFGHVLLRGNRAKKISHTRLDAIVTPNCAPLANLGATFELEPHTLHRKFQSLELKTNLVTNIVEIKLFPGITNEFILGMVPPRTEAIILEAYGTGNMPLGEEGIQEAIENVINQGIIVVVATQCMYGGVEYERYQGGYFAKTRGALSAQDMTSEAALIKLMWVLGQTHDYQEVKRLYHTNLVGELTEREDYGRN